jgi:hypothetical protein
MLSLRLHHLKDDVPRSFLFEAVHLPMWEKYQPEVPVLLRSFVCIARTCPLSLESFAGLQIRMTKPLTANDLGERTG